MKKLLIFLVAAILFVSCNKTQDITQTFNQQERASGVLPDPPELKAKMQLQVSQEFAIRGRTISFVNGKRTLDLSAIEANQVFQAEAKPGKGNISGGNGGGTTGGSTSGGTVVVGDVTAPRIMITTPEPAQMYNLQSMQYTRMSWFIAADDETDLRRVVVKIKGDVVKDTSGIINADGTNGIWTVIQDIYSFPYGDGAYDMTAQAWDAKGNTTITSLVFYRNTQMTPLPTNFPAAYTMPHMTTNQYISQGGEGSCAAFTVANAYSIDRYNKEGQTKGFNSNNVYSPEWIYNIAVGGRGCGSGSGILSNMGIVVNRGVPTWNYLPYSSQNGCDTSMFTDAIRNNASQNKGVWGYAVATADRNLIKMKVTQNKPAMFGTQLDRQLTYWISPNTIWTFPHYRDGGPHSMIIVGYDDSKNAYLVLNSWSSDWGNVGRVWIDYDFFEQEVSSGCWYFG